MSITITIFLFKTQVNVYIQLYLFSKSTVNVQIVLVNTVAGMSVVESYFGTDCQLKISTRKWTKNA